jgi:hypothetical protein
MHEAYGGILPVKRGSSAPGSAAASTATLAFPNGNDPQDGSNPRSKEKSRNVISDVMDVDSYAHQIRVALGRSAHAILETASIVAQARDTLDHASFRQLAKLVGLSHGTISKFVAIHSRRDRFAGREESLPGSWTVIYRLSKLTDGQYETIAAPEKLRPELTEREVSKFVAQNEAANDVSRSAADELACLAVRIVFPALLSLQQEDAIKQKIFEALDGDPALTIRVSERRKFKASRG